MDNFITAFLYILYTYNDKIALTYAVIDGYLTPSSLA
jgi:hypothetical protein